MTTGTTVLDIQNVDLTFPDGQSRVTALDDVSLRLHRGEIAAITGLPREIAFTHGHFDHCFGAEAFG
ncbi:MAG: hypothetical protein ABS976_24710, partial [Rhodococcus sp. (in: high G+C Gram-positive bacteria)]